MTDTDSAAIYPGSPDGNLPSPLLKGFDPELLTKNVVLTPYYRTRSLVGPRSSNEESDLNYSALTLFCLRTRLSPYLKRQDLAQYYIQFDNLVRDNLMYVTIGLTDGLKQIEMDASQLRSLQQEVNRLVAKFADYCLIYPFLTESHLYDQDERLIPADWINSMLPYLSFSDELNPFITKDGIYVKLSDTIGPTGQNIPDGGLRGVLAGERLGSTHLLGAGETKVRDYKQFYHQITKSINQQLQKMYRQGYLSEPSADLIKNWHLVRVNLELEAQKDLYRSSWQDDRITDFKGGLVNFLKSRQQGQTHIDIRISDNKVVRHTVAAYLSTVEGLSGKDVQPIMIGPYVRFQATNYQQANQLTSLVLLAVGQANGRVMILKTSRLSWALIYLSIATKSGNSDCLIYRTDDSNHPIIFSCLISIDVKISFLQEQIQQAAKQTLVNLAINLTEVKANYPTAVQPNISVHDAIEDGYIVL